MALLVEETAALYIFRRLAAKNICRSPRAKFAMRIYLIFLSRTRELTWRRFSLVLTLCCELRGSESSRISFPSEKDKEKATTTLSRIACAVGVRGVLITSSRN